MTSFITGAFPLRSRLKTSLPSLALAATALVGGASVLSGGQAQAFNCSFGSNTAYTACSTGTPNASNPASDKTITFKVLPTQPGHINFDWMDVNANGTWNQPADLMVDQWHVDTTYDPGLTAATGPSTLEYIISITDPSMVFGNSSLISSIFPTTSGSVTKGIFKVTSSGGKGDLITTLTNSGTSTLPAGYKQLYIVDTATPTGSGVISSFENVYQQTTVPGPLPLVGAGAAFGFTRKLRRRVKAFRMA